MRIAVLGTGVVGRTLAAAFSDLGHEVMLGTRDVEATLARGAAERAGGPLAEWLVGHPAVRLAAFSDIGGFGDVIVNATNGSGSLAALESVGAEHLAGRVVIDVANPLDFSAGFPPTLSVKDTDSLGEQLQRAFPEARVVKALNTVTAAVMVAPGSIEGAATTAFISGDDPDAKDLVRGMLAALGWRDVLDLGDISTSRGPEMYLPLWLRIMGALGTPMFNVAVVRPQVR